MTRAERSAAPARVPPETRVYAIGDSHGCAERLEVLHAEILRDAAGAPPRRVAVYLGDYIDRGPDSRGVIELLVQHPLEGFERIHLIGNHDAFLLEALAEGRDVLPWLMNGGDATLRSYGIDPWALTRGGDPAGWLRGELAQRLPATHRRFLEELRLSHVEGDYLFVHAGIRPGRPLEAQDPWDLLWIREPFLGSAADHGKIVVHGHTPGLAPEVRANRIAIDTGACYGGSLTALVLEGDARRFLQV